MEAQPLAMAVAFLSVLFGGTPDSAPLSVGEIALFLLGLLWWAMALASWQARGRIRSPQVVASLRLGGLLAAWGALVLSNFSHLADVWAGPEAFLLLSEALLVFWFWRRGLSRARLGFTYEPLAISFQVGLGALLVITLLSLLLAHGSLLLPDLEASLTIFFFCGLITLSLARLGILRQVRVASGKQADPTRAWLGALILFSCLLIALVFILEAAFSYTSFLGLLHFLQPVWDLLGTIVGWLLYAILFLILSPLFAVLSWVFDWFRSLGNGGKQPTQPPSSPFAHLATGKTTQLPPELLSIGRWVVLGVAVLIVLMLVRASLRRWFLPYDAEQLEETREHLGRLPQERQRKREAERAGKQGAGLSQDADSARAYYRLLLHTVAAQHAELAHQPEETPLEYEQRLREQVDPLVTTPEETRGRDVGVPGERNGEPDSAILQTLTQAYMDERYGQQQTDPHRHSYLRRWMPRLLKTLTRK